MSKFEEVLAEVPEQDRTIAALAAYRFLNSTGDAGRPSDAARSIVREYQQDPARFVQREAELRQREHAERGR